MLDTRYRPTKFSQVLGNQGAIKLLLARSRAGTLTEQSMLFGGPKGCGKTTLARIVARAIVCSSLQDGEPCGECDNCVSILQDSSSDFEELDAASQGTVDKIRSMIRDTDYEGGRRIYLVDEAQRLTSQAQDAMLKAIEERLLTFIFCTTEPHKIKTPIRSRMEEYPIYPPPQEELLARLSQICKNESIESDQEALKIIIQMHDSCPRSSIISLSTLRVHGSITKESVSSHFRFGSFSEIDKVLTLLDQNPAKAMTVLDSLSTLESPSWIRDQIVFAIASALRYDVGARSRFPVPLHFFEYRLQEWLSLSKSLSSIDRPMISDIESALLTPRNWSPKPPSVSSHVSSIPAQISSSPVVTPSPTPSPVVVQEVLPPKPSPAPEPKAVLPKESLPKVVKKPLEIDGVKFHADERLTSLDDKIERGHSTPPPAPASEGVEFGKDHVPISIKDFGRGLTRRVRGSS